MKISPTSPCYWGLLVMCSMKGYKCSEKIKDIFERNVITLVSVFWCVFFPTLRFIFFNVGRFESGRGVGGERREWEFFSGWEGVGSRMSAHYFRPGLLWYRFT